MSATDIKLPGLPAIRQAGGHEELLAATRKLLELGFSPEEIYDAMLNEAVKFKESKGE